MLTTAFNLINDSPEIRELMVEELMHDVSADRLDVSTHFTEDGANQWPIVLAEAMLHGWPETLVEAVIRRRFVRPASPRREAETFVFDQFSKFYIRAVCRRAMQLKVPKVVVYRMRESEVEDPESKKMEGQEMDPFELLADLRTHRRQTPRLGVPAHPNSGLGVLFFERVGGF